MLIDLILFFLIPLCGVIVSIVAVVKDQHSSHGRHLHGGHF
jgi:hypothetical protein